MEVHNKGLYTMSGGEGTNGEGYKMNGVNSGKGGGMGYSMAGPGMESTVGEKSPEANTKGKMEENKNK